MNTDTTDTRAPFDQCGSVWDAIARNLVVIIHCLLLCAAHKIPPNIDCTSFLESFLPIIPSIMTYQPHSYPFKFFKQTKILLVFCFFFHRNGPNLLQQSQYQATPDIIQGMIQIPVLGRLVFSFLQPGRLHSCPAPTSSIPIIFRRTVLTV